MMRLFKQIEKNESDPKVLRKYQRQAKQGVFANGVLLLVAALFDVIFRLKLSVPLLVEILVFGILGLSFVGDVVTVFHCGARIRRLQAGQ